jgi:quercetin dioxygenase-like cupin family protein
MKKRLTLLLAIQALYFSTGDARETATPAPEHDSLPHALSAGWHGKDMCEILFEDENNVVGRCVFPPGTGHEKHYHNPHFGYVLEGGTMSITDSSGNRVVTTTSGGTWSTTTLTVHEAVNTGQTTTSYLIVEPKTQ